MPIRQVPITAIMTAELTAAFERTMSPERWRTYRFAAGFRQDLALGLYLWNAAIGQSFHFPLQAVEVALRNVIHTALSAKYGANWCFTDACRAMIGPRMVNDLEKAEQRHRKIYAQTPSTPQLLASLSLGFWVALLRRPFHVALWDGQIITAFPHLEPDKTLADVSKVGTAIQDLRNRIFHQEPLIGHNLSQHYGDILKMLGWICDDTRQWVRQHSSVPRVIRERPR